MFVKYEFPEILRDKDWVIIGTPQNEQQLKTHLFLRGTTHTDFSTEDIPELLKSVDNYEEVYLKGNITYKMMFKEKEFLTLTVPLSESGI